MAFNTVTPSSGNAGSPFMIEDDDFSDGDSKALSSFDYDDLLSN